MNNRIFCLTFIVINALTAIAQTREVKGTYTYLADPNQSLKEAKAAAIQSARIAALGKVFGTLITQDVLNEEKDGDSFFMQLSSSEVKGEWIEDTKKPEAKVIDTTSDDILVIEATVEGRARAISNDAVDVKVLALRNARSDDSNYQRYASSDFVEGDKFYLYFRTPVKGYVAAFLIDEQQQVFCLLPHANSSEGSLEVERNKDYVFFSANHDAAFSNSYEDGMRVTCADERLEMNRIYVIFSPNPFVKPIDYDGPPLGNNLFLPRQLSLKDFSRWMNKVYANDKKMSRQVVRIRIKK